MVRLYKLIMSRQDGVFRRRGEWFVIAGCHARLEAVGELFFLRSGYHFVESVWQLLELTCVPECQRFAFSAGTTASQAGFFMVLFFIVTAASMIFVLISFLHFLLPAATGMRGPAFGRTAVDLTITGTFTGDRVRDGRGPQDQRGQ